MRKEGLRRGYKKENRSREGKKARRTKTGRKGNTLYTVVCIIIELYACISKISQEVCLEVIMAD